MPNTRIGNDVIIGAGSVVTKDCDSGSVYVGNPARKIMSIDDYVLKERERLDKSYVYDDRYTIRKNISKDKKKRQKKELASGIGYVK